MHQPPKPAPAAPAAALLIGCLLASACAGPSAARRETTRLAEAEGPRAAVARAVLEAERAGPGAEAGEWLEAAWPQRVHLLDDRVLRRALADVPREATPDALRADRTLEAAREALEAGDEVEAARLAEEAREAAGEQGGEGWTRARAAILAAGLTEARHPARARLWLEAAARRRLPGAPGAYLRDLARLTLAGLHHRDERYREAIAAYLELGPESGFWRRSRLGLAWVQLRAGRPERTLKILALLPGGLTGDPERAVVAAMAAHLLGHVAAARAIVDEALARLPAWEVPEDVDGAVLERVRSAPGGPRLRQDAEGLAETLSDRGRVRLLGREVLAAREAADTPAMGRYVERLEAAWARVLAEEVARERQRVEGAVADLRALRPQLDVTPEPR